MEVLSLLLTVGYPGVAVAKKTLPKFMLFTAIVGRMIVLFTKRTISIKLSFCAFTVVKNFLGRHCTDFEYRELSAFERILTYNEERNAQGQFSVRLFLTRF